MFSLYFLCLWGKVTPLWCFFRISLLVQMKPADSALRNCSKETTPTRQNPLRGTAGIPLPPLGKICSLILPKFYAVGQNGTVCLVGDVGLNRNRELFCFGRNGKQCPKKRCPQKPNDTEKHSLNRITTSPRPHLAGTQTALPSVPEPMQGSFAAEPTSRSRCQASP